jgi:hypothetical protein
LRRNNPGARSVQTRQIEDVDYTQLVTGTIATLQDYHFRIRAELTLLIRERGEDTYSARMNMSTGLASEHGSELYQQFFATLHKKRHFQSKA